jgi:hypothetical protein
MTDGYDYKVLICRDHHGGIVEDKIRGRGSVKRYRSAPDARLFESMTCQQEGAFSQIARTYNLRTAGLGARIGKYGELCGQTGQGDVEYGADMLRRYDSWIAACRRAYLSPIMALEVIVYGLSLAEVDKKHGFRHGTAKKNLLAALDEWPHT